jgi:hypothetical protein
MTRSMTQTKYELLCVNREIERATKSFDRGGYVYCDAAAEYAKEKKAFVKLHERAFRSRGTWRQRRAFSAAYQTIVERMRHMHKDLIEAKEHNKTLIRENDARYERGFAELEGDLDFQKFEALFNEYAAWNETHSTQPRPFNTAETKLAISRYTDSMKKGGYNVTPIWIAPHMFEMYATSGCDSAILRTHAAFQSLINVKVPNATIAWNGVDNTELRLWDSGYVFYGEAATTSLSTAICRLEFDQKTQAFKLDVEPTPLFFRKVPAYVNPTLTWPQLAEWAAFHRAFLSKIKTTQPEAMAGDNDEDKSSSSSSSEDEEEDRALDNEIHNCEALLQLMSTPRMANIPPERLNTLMRAFNVGTATA